METVFLLHADCWQSVEFKVSGLKWKQQTMGSKHLKYNRYKDDGYKP